MSGTSAVLQRSSWAKFYSKTPVSTPSKIKVCEFESLIRGQYKTFSAKESALETKPSFFFFLSESVSYVGLCEARFSGSSCFVTDWILKLLLQTEAQTRKNCSMSNQMVNNGRTKTFYELCSFFGFHNISLLLLSCFFNKNNRALFRNSFKFCLFMLCWLLLSRLTKHWQKNLINSSLKGRRKGLYQLWENDWNTWRVERLM